MIDKRFFRNCPTCGQPTQPAKKKVEWSKVFCGIFALVGFGIVVAYFWAIFADKQPDASVAVAGITEILGTVLGYLLYQAKLKDSRNRYGVDEKGVPYPDKSKDNEEDETC